MPQEPFEVWAPPDAPWSAWAKPVLFAYINPQFPVLRPLTFIGAGM